MVNSNSGIENLFLVNVRRIPLLMLCMQYALVVILPTVESLSRMINWIGQIDKQNLKCYLEFYLRIHVYITAKLILFIRLLVLNLLNRRVAVLYLSRALPKTNHRLSDELPFGLGKDRSSICFIICVHCDLSLSTNI